MKNFIQAVLIINAKRGPAKGSSKAKGWTDEARKKAAMTRKRKTQVKEDKPKSNKKFLPGPEDPEMKKKIKEINNNPKLSKASKEAEIARLFPPSTEEINHVKALANSIRKKNPTDAEWLDNIHSMLADDIKSAGQSWYNAYYSDAASDWKDLSKPLKGALSPRIQFHMKKTKASKGDSDEGYEDGED